MHDSVFMKTIPMILVLWISVVSSTSFAYQLKSDGSGSPVRVASTETVFRLPTSAPQGLDLAAVHQAIENSLQGWSDASGLALQSAPGDPYAEPGYVAEGENHNDIIFVEKDWKWDDQAVAITLITINQTTHTILDTDILFNAQQHRFAILPEEDKESYFDDVENTFNHEMGHSLGLAHSEFSHAVMYGQAERGEISKRVLSDDDIAAVKVLYAEAPLSEEALNDKVASMGCSSTSRSAPMLGLLALLAVALVYRKPQSSYVLVKKSPRRK